ncbi:hypothetical protein PUN28_002871 [Cardiocondyla obscurior]|uniref:Ribosomal protein S12 n=1 Tax=Cardiocondyla obscurior TaxID=286306 RepID=A0AAW2GWS7_9HYME
MLSTFRQFARAALLVSEYGVSESCRERAVAYGPEFSISGGCPSFSTSAVALFKCGVFEVPSDNFKPLLFGQIKPYQIRLIIVLNLLNKKKKKIYSIGKKNRNQRQASGNQNISNNLRDTILKNRKILLKQNVNPGGIRQYCILQRYSSDISHGRLAVVK